MKTIKTPGVLKAVASAVGGVPVMHNKNTADKATVRMPAPERAVIAMLQHIGAPCVPTVKPGDIVGVGQVVGDSERIVSAPVHASISGKVASVGEITLPNGVVTRAVTIESDGEMRLFEGITPPAVRNKDDLIKALRASGLVGLGGAGFPTHVKLNIPPAKKVTTLIINAAECEPYITTDYRECVENARDLLSGVFTVKELLGLENAIIAIEDNKPKAFEILRNTAAAEFGSKSGVKLMALKSRYPQGAEKVLIRSATGKSVPPGKLPADVGCVVMNACSVAFVARYLETGKPLVSRTLTVDGSAIADPKNVRVPIGTKIADVLAFCGGFKEEPFKILMGGPMMGLALADTELPILKQNNAILAFAGGTLRTKRERDCIRCGRCAFVCPMNLVPTKIMNLAKAKDAEKLENCPAEVCMECGSCAYACPSGIPLVQYLRLAKTLKTEAGDNS